MIFHRSTFYVVFCAYRRFFVKIVKIIDFCSMLCYTYIEYILRIRKIIPHNKNYVEHCLYFFDRHFNVR